MTSRLERLPAELRRAILSLVIWAPTPPPAFTQQPFPDRVRLRDSLAVWVEPTPRPPPALSLLLTSRTLYYEVQSLVSSNATSYELDIAFVDECGLFPTWTVCPLPSQTHISTLRVSIRILSAEEIKVTRPHCQPASGAASASSAVDDRFAARFPGSRSPFMIDQNDPLPPQGACNFYHLLTRFLALGPLGAVTPETPGPASHTPSADRRRRYTINTLIITTTSKPSSFWDTIRWLRLHPMAISSNRTDIPFAALGEPLHFPALLPPDDFPEYVWSGRATPSMVDMSTGTYDGERLGLYLALGVGGLLNLSAPLGRAFGRRLYEGVLGTVEFWVDGERRARPVYDTERLLALLPPPPPPTAVAAHAEDGGSGSGSCDDGPPAVGEGLEGWRRWVAVFPPGRLAAANDSYGQAAAPHFHAQGLPPPPRLRPEDVPPDMAEGLEAWRRWVVVWRRGRREDVAKGRIWGM